MPPGKGGAESQRHEVPLPGRQKEGERKDSPDASVEELIEKNKQAISAAIRDYLEVEWASYVNNCLDRLGLGEREAADLSGGGLKCSLLHSWRGAMRLPTDISEDHFIEVAGPIRWAASSAGGSCFRYVASSRLRDMRGPCAPSWTSLVRGILARHALSEEDVERETGLVSASLVHAWQYSHTKRPSLPARLKFADFARRHREVLRWMTPSVRGGFTYRSCWADLTSITHEGAPSGIVGKRVRRGSDVL